MPVPVPRQFKPIAHPVVKKPVHPENGGQTFHYLTGTLPVAPTGPPPSFGTREEWINSLPTWRRAKPRRIWEDDSRHQDFQHGLAAAVDASVIKGPHVDTCTPPEQLQDYLEADDEMSPDPSPVGGQGNSDATWSAADVEHTFPSTELSSYDHFERGAFSPIYEDQSAGSGPDNSSSPLEPATPFGDFVDRAVATAGTDSGDFSAYSHEEKPYYAAPPAYQPPVTTEVQKDLVPAPAPDVVTPTANAGYKKLAEPLSEWVADFVWKACTTDFVQHRSGLSVHTPNAPTYLATSVHSLLLSTLLQPSAVFLALWYIRKLPVYMGAVLSPEHHDELEFRSVLFGEGRSYGERDVLEVSVPFRLIVLGCMLANKWLDDHTFSNKTWHTISAVPIHTLNRLEVVALKLFTHDLTISRTTWCDWLSTVVAYHQSLSAPGHPQPIARPSSNPHSMIRKALEEIMQAPTPWHNDVEHPQPVFLGLEERRKERMEREQALAHELEIDLDEDGPLREEYLPKRRTSSASAQAPVETSQNYFEKPQIWEKPLPPPAKWSPAADEPILRDRNRASGQYVAVQPPPANVAPGYVLPVYAQSQEYGYGQPQWPMGGAYMKTTPPAPPSVGYFYDATNGGMASTQALYHRVPLYLPVTMSHSRSQSVSYDQDISQPTNHLRSHSQSRFEYRCSDIRMTAVTHESMPLPPPERPVGSSVWGGNFGYAAPPVFLPQPAYQANWIRT